MIHEYRIYSCVPGQMPRLLSRFENHTFKFWKKHGIRAIGFWQVLVGEGFEDLHYILEWGSMAEREERWNAFMNDPDWAVVWEETERDGPTLSGIKSTFLQPMNIPGAVLTGTVG